MNSILNKPRLWTYGEAVRLFGLPDSDGRRTIRTLVKAHNLIPVQLAGKGKGLSLDDLKVLGKALNKPLGRVDRPSV